MSISLTRMRNLAVYLPGTIGRFVSLYSVVDRNGSILFLNNIQNEFKQLNWDIIFSRARFHLD